jgi:hypothetical protein
VDTDEMKLDGGLGMYDDDDATTPKRSPDNGATRSGRESASSSRRSGRGQSQTLVPAIPRSEVASTQSLAKACSTSGVLRLFGGAAASSTKEPEETPDKEVHVVVSGPEPGYVATPAIFFALAMCVLEERERLPKGGVFTPAAAFFDCPSVFNRLMNAGINIQVLSSDTDLVAQHAAEVAHSSLAGRAQATLAAESTPTALVKEADLDDGTPVRQQVTESDSRLWPGTLGQRR